MTEARREVARIVAASNSSFGAAMRLLPGRRRRAILAVYAYCRLLDDMVDGPAPLAEKRAFLDGWADELGRIEARIPETPVGRELRHAIDAHALPIEELAMVLDGMRMDLDGVVAPSPERLDAYVRRVAGAVGILSMHVFGAWRGAPSRRFALALAEALQLTNIARDIEEDAGLGRLYLPAPLLAECGLPADPARLPDAAGLARARLQLAARARAGFDAARAEIPAHPRLRLAPALMMMGAYAALLRRIEAAPDRPPPRQTRWDKLAAGLRCLATGQA
jgi:phytoene synthase